MDECAGAMIYGQINRLRLDLSNDFVALALRKEDSRQFVWRYVIGYINERYRRMVVKRGKGLPGMALRLGRALVMDGQASEIGRIVAECPLMLAEGLQAAAVAPIRNVSGDIGVLLVGSRQGYIYTVRDLDKLQECADNLIRWISGMKPAT